jgi:DNA-directed RNA polymerase subunit RPC12/RpoP
MDYEQVRCTKCGKKVQVTKGFLTQDGVANYVCETCSEQVLERRVADFEDRKGGRTLLTD